MTAAAMPARDRITRVRFRGLRTAADVELHLEPMTVLIGPNGVGKSTLIEGFEMLRKLASTTDFLRTLNDEHGGVSYLLRRGTTQLVFDVDLTAAGDRYRYHVALASRGGAFHVESEALVLADDQQVLFSRQGDTLRHEGRDRPAPKGTVLSNLALLNPLVGDVHSVLSGIEVHVPFATQARWFGPGLVPERNLRMDNIVQSTDRVDRGGANLANAFHALRNRPDWADTLDTIKLVIDDDITDVTTPASAGGGNIGLSVSYRTTGAVPAFALSDGTLALLALIAITRLDGGETHRSLLVLDEPELHLHPGAVGQVVALLEECGNTQPVVIATHSDRVLDGLSDPAGAAVLCDLDEQRQLRLRRPDRTQLDRWLKDFRGLGQVREEGYDQLVFPLTKSAGTA